MPGILATWETEVKRMGFQFSPGKKFVRYHINRRELAMVAHICHLSDGSKFKIARSQSRAAQAKSKTLSPKSSE
jgi:hypothetical protein